MADKFQDQLGAYLDGELDPRGQNQVTEHLKTCQVCQGELEELRRITQLLQAAPPAKLTPVLDFRAQLMLQLPRRAETANPRPGGSLLPWMAPVLVLAGWIFVQVALGLSTLVALTGQLGFLDGAAAWVNSSPQQMQWFAAAQALFGGMLGQDGQVILQVINDTNLFSQNMFIFLLWQVGAAVLYWGIMTLLWKTNVKAVWSSLTTG